TTGEDREIKPERGAKIRRGTLTYRKRDLSTALLRDEVAPRPFEAGALPQPDAHDDEMSRTARLFRQGTGSRLPDSVQFINPNPLPATAEAYDGIDQVILASQRIADDPVGMRALRHWLQRGGRLWVMLDVVEPELIAPLLGEALDFQVVDRV